jgi:hypothetical protein
VVLPIPLHGPLIAEKRRMMKLYPPDLHMKRMKLMGKTLTQTL